MIRFTKLALLLCTLLVVSGNLFAQDTFEGKITQTLKVPMLGGEAIPMIMNVKGEKMMMTMDKGPMGGMKLFFQEGGKKMVTIMEAQNMGFELDMPAGAAAAGEQIPDFKATGKKETINGYASEEWAASLENGMTLNLWLSNDLDKSLIAAMTQSMKSLTMQNAPGSEAIFGQIADKSMCAVRATIASGGETQAEIDLVKIEKTSIADDVFVVPSNIKLTKLDPSMMQGR